LHFILPPFAPGISSSTLPHTSPLFRAFLLVGWGVGWGIHTGIPKMAFSKRVFSYQLHIIYALGSKNLMFDPSLNQSINNQLGLPYCDCRARREWTLGV
jgi:hypothetical protein